MASGQHLCALYQDQDERREVTAAVIRGGLAAGDRVMYVASGPPEVALSLLEAGGIETGRPLSGGQLLVHSFGEIYGDPAALDLALLVDTFRVASLPEIYQIAAGLPGGGQIALANATEPVRRVLDLAGFRAGTVVVES